MEYDLCELEEWTTLSLASYVSLFVSFHVSEYTLRSKTLKGSAKAFSVEHDWSPRKSTRALLPALATVVLSFGDFYLLNCAF